MNAIPNTVHKSNWGYHPCSLATSKKLRTINRVYMKALSMDANHERWDNKQPQNRVLYRTLRDETGQRIGRKIFLNENNQPVQIPKPPICPVFIMKSTFPPPKYKVRRINEIGETILKASRQARKPVPTPEEVKFLPLSEQEIENLYQKCLDFLGK